ncbi:MAG TPA: Ig-like domain-containing protein, partial [Casimicrobiaceae bacterium]|nr:Ig-like domain-containing protein [Casimicrobiaceae bacterium]
PTVSITSPTGGNVSGTVTISANAADNVGVARVDFYINSKYLSSREEFHTGGTLLGSAAGAPYQISWDTAAYANGTASLYAKAFDAAGNSTLSAIVTVNIANAAVRPSAAARPSAAGPVTSYAIEYYNSALDHYFVSASAADINMLDSGKVVGWSRTGYAFKVYAQPSGTANPVCRFYLPPAFGDSHFYSASPTECADVLAQFPMFVLESPGVFYANLPDPDTGACPANMTPVYRMWNGRSDANHRYVTDPSLRDQMALKGYVAEGYGPDAVILCAPM